MPSSNTGQEIEICKVKPGGEENLSSELTQCYSVDAVRPTSDQHNQRKLLEKELNIQKINPCIETAAFLAEIPTYLEASWPRLSCWYVRLIVNFQFWCQCNNCFNHQ